MSALVFIKSKINIYICVIYSHYYNKLIQKLFTSMAYVTVYLNFHNRLVITIYMYIEKSDSVTIALYINVLTF